MAPKPLTRVNNVLIHRRELFVELPVARRRNIADVEIKPLNSLEAGGGKGIVLFGEIDAETRLNVATDKVVY